MKKILRLWNTIKFLKPVQIYGRIWFKLYKPKPSTIESSGLRRHARKIGPGASRQSTLTAPSTFHVLGDKLTVNAPSSWNDSKCSKLLLFNIHYFDDLNSTPPEVDQHTHAALIDRWIDDNPAPTGNGWEPYPLSLRIVNWTRFMSRVAEPKRSWQNSLYQQTLFLSRRIEHHIQGNHLFVNAKALLFAGSYFEGDEADRLRKLAEKIVLKELDEQVLDDGGNFELSPMYHCIFLEDLLDILSLTLSYPELFSSDFTQRLENRTQKMLVWLGHMVHPDDDITFFNDATLFIAPTYEALTFYAERLGIHHSLSTERLWHGESSGYVVYKNDEAYCAMDIGEIGPAYLTAHSHADTLSFELSLHQQRVFVNSGISEYGVSQERLRQRGTDAHNTVCVNSSDSSHVWSGFRVAQRASIASKTIEMQDTSSGEIVITGEHDGYRSHGNNCIHRRTWSIAKRSIDISDDISGIYKTAVAHYLIHPDVSISLQGNTAYLKLLSGDLVTITVKMGIPSLVESTWHPAFTKIRNTKKLCIEQLGSKACMQIHWLPKIPQKP